MKINKMKKVNAMFWVSVRVENKRHVTISFPMDTGFIWVTDAFQGSSSRERRLIRCQVNITVHYRHKYMHVHNDSHSSLSTQVDGDEYSKRITAPHSISPGKDGIVVLNISKPCINLGENV